MFCIECGTKVEVVAKFCANCGTKVTKPEASVGDNISKINDVESSGKGFDIDDLVRRAKEVTDLDESLILWRKAAEMGSADAQYKLYSSLDYDEHDYTDVETKESIKWLQTAAEQGHTEAMFELAECYEDGYGIDEQNYLEQDYMEAARLYHKIATEHEDYPIATVVGKLEDVYSNEPSAEHLFVDALKQLRLAAHQGDADAQYMLGHFYQSGKGVKKDWVEALKWLQRAKEQGHQGVGLSLTILNLSQAIDENNERRQSIKDSNADVDDILQRAEGLRDVGDLVEAAKLWRMAADLGNAEAQYQLGECYLLGDGVEMDDEEAIKWYRYATEQGHEVAELALENFFNDGKEKEQGYLDQETEEAMTTFDTMSEGEKQQFVEDNAMEINDLLLNVEETDDTILHDETSALLFEALVGLQKEYSELADQFDTAATSGERLEAIEAMMLNMNKQKHAVMKLQKEGFDIGFDEYMTGIDTALDSHVALKQKYLELEKLKERAGVDTKIREEFWDDALNPSALLLGPKGFLLNAGKALLNLGAKVAKDEFKKGI